MWRLTLHQIARRRARSLAVIAAIVVAAVSFCLLSASVATSRLAVQGTINNNYRSAYDILVRPKGSTSGLEASDHLVRENFLSGIFGGISMNQYHQIESIKGVQVAAPIAMVGYVLPQLNYTQFITRHVLDNPATQQLYRLRQTWTADRGLSHYPGAGSFANAFNYVTRAPTTFKGGYSLTVRDPLTGGPIAPCTRFNNRQEAHPGTSAFDPESSVGILCDTTRPEPKNYDYPGNKIGTSITYPFPILIAAIDPQQEAKLVGLGNAVDSGRYLRENDGGYRACVKKHNPSTCGQMVPMIMADRTTVDQQLSLAWQQLTVPNPAEIPSKIASPQAARWLLSLKGSTIKSRTFQTAQVYRQLIREYRKPVPAQNPQYWSTSPVRYKTAADGHLTPIPVSNPPLTWQQTAFAGDPYFAPAASADTGFRHLHLHLGSHTGAGAPGLHAVGTFDPSKLLGFSKLTQVPLTTYYAPTAQPGDARTSRLLHGKPLLPSANLAGYLQQPPLMLTTLNALPFLRGAGFIDEDSVQKAPISAIRIRVAGVHGVDKLSQARVRLVAAQIVRQTGLDVDITVGSSPTTELVNLPAGQYGRPPLTLKEGWVKKGVAVSLLNAIDTKSLALFGLVLLVCVVFLANATVAAVHSRRSELGVLACLGWPARKITQLLFVELLTLGVVSGLAGTLIGALLTSVRGLSIAWWQLALITPVATLLATAAGLLPVWRAGRVPPLEAIAPVVRVPRRASRVRSVWRLALAGVARKPGRTALGAASLFIAVAAFTVLIAIQRSFNGEVTSSVLGNVVAVQVRGVDYFAAVLILVLAGFAIADIAYLNITERGAEVGTLRASGWDERHLRRLFSAEALVIAALGAVVGAACSIAGVQIAFPNANWADTLGAGAVAVAAGLLCAVIAVVVPVGRLSKLAPIAAINTE